MMVHYGPPDLSKIENLLKRLVHKDSTEDRVLKRYVQLAGLVQNGQMVNKDKESRARQWVFEQEKIERERRPNWHQTWWGGALIGFSVGVAATVIGGLILVAIL